MTTVGGRARGGTELAHARWPELAEPAEPAEPPGGAGREPEHRPLVLLPLGATEQHGPHLPFGTDTVIAAAVAAATARLLPADAHAVVAPALPYGASGEHAHFPGTISLGHEALGAVLVEAVRSLALWAGRVVLVNGHGGNLPGLVAAVTRLRAERHDVAWAPCAPPGADPHAGRSETSLMLHLAPGDVEPSRAVAGDTRPLGVLLPELRERGVRAVSPSGVLGDPAGASAEEGRALLDAMAAATARAVTAWRPDSRGMLGG